MKSEIRFDGSVSYSMDFGTNADEEHHQTMTHHEQEEDDEAETFSFSSPAEIEQFLSLLVDESGNPAYTMKWNDEEIHINEYEDQVPHDYYEYQPVQDVFHLIQIDNSWHVLETFLNAVK